MSSSKSLNKLKIMRKLGEEESIYDNEIIHGDFILSLIVKTSIQIEYSDRITLDLLKQAAKYWQNKYCLLKSTIWRSFDIKNSDEVKIGTNKYFVQMEQPDLLNNIQLESTNDEEYWKEALKQEIDTQFDNINGPLWRIKVIKHFLAHFSTRTKYFFFYTAHHSLGDGRNNFGMISDYLSILDDLLQFEKVKSIDLNPIESKFCMEDLVNEYKKREDYKSLSIETNEYNPTFNKLSFKTGNRERGSQCLIEFLEMERSKLNKLIEKMKKETNGAKLTSVLHSLLVICMRMLYEEYQIDDIDEMNLIQSKILVSLRGKLNIPNQQMGVYSVALLNQVNISKYMNKQESFWQLTENESFKLHARLENNEDMEQIGQKEEELIQLLNSNYDFSTHTSQDFVLSNLGKMCFNSMHTIKCDEFYFSMEIINPSFAGSFFNGVLTLDENLFWCFTFDDKYYSLKFVQQLKQRISCFIDQLISN